MFIFVVYNSMFWCRFSRFTSCWRFCTTPWPSTPSRHFPFSWYSWGMQWVASGTWTAAWSRRDALWLMQGNGIYQVYADSILVIWRLHSIYIPTLFLSYDDFIPSIYRLYSCHMMILFHIYTDSIPVIWWLHSIYTPTLFLSYDDFIPSIYRLYSWAGEGCGATFAA